MGKKFQTVAGQRTVSKLTILTPKEYKELKVEQWHVQLGVCPILRIYSELKEMVLDHKHRRKDEPIGVDGKGLIRGLIHKEANRFEGKILQFYKRYGLEKFASLPFILRNLADYIEDPPMGEEYVHPSELPKPEKLTKRQKNLIKKHYFAVYPRRKKLPKFPKSGKLTEKMDKILKDIDKFLA